MGYYAYGGGPLYIKHENFQKIVDALRNRCQWMREEDITDIGDAFDKFGFTLGFTNENVTYCYYDEEKWHSDDSEFLFSTIAPYVDNGSHMDFTGEDDAHWRSSFFCGQWIETEGLLTYPGDPYDEPGPGAPLG